MTLDINMPQDLPEGDLPKTSLDREFYDRGFVFKDLRAEMIKLYKEASADLVNERKQINELIKFALSHGAQGETPLQLRAKIREQITKKGRDPESKEVMQLFSKVGQPDVLIGQLRSQFGEIFPLLNISEDDPGGFIEFLAKNQGATAEGFLSEDPIKGRSRHKEDPFYGKSLFEQAYEAAIGMSGIQNQPADAVEELLANPDPLGRKADAEAARQALSAAKEAEREQARQQRRRKSMFRKEITASKTERFTTLRNQLREEQENERFAGLEEGQQFQVNTDVARSVSRMIGAPALGELFNQFILKPARDESTNERRQAMAERRKTQEAVELAIRQQLVELVKDLDMTDDFTDEVEQDFRERLQMALGTSLQEDDSFDFGANATPDGGTPSSPTGGGQGGGGGSGDPPIVSPDGEEGPEWYRRFAGSPIGQKVLSKLGGPKAAALGAIASRAALPVAAVMAANTVVNRGVQTGAALAGSPFAGSPAGAAQAASSAINTIPITNILAGPIVESMSSLVSLSEKIEQNTRKDLFAAPESLMASLNKDISLMLKRMEEMQTRDPYLAEIISANGRLEMAIEEFKTVVITSFGSELANVIDAISAVINFAGDIIGYLRMYYDFLSWIPGTIPFWMETIDWIVDWLRKDDKTDVGFAQIAGLERFLNPDSSMYNNRSNRKNGHYAPPGGPRVPQGFGNPRSFKYVP